MGWNAEVSARDTNTQACWWHAVRVSAIGLFFFFTVTDGAASLKILVKGTASKMSQDVPASIYSDLVWVQLRRPHTGLLVERTISTLYIACASLFPTPNHAQPPLIKQVHGSMAVSLPLVRFTMYKRPWDTLHFLCTLPDRTWTILGDAFSISLNGLVDDPCLCVKLAM